MLIVSERERERENKSFPVFPITDYVAVDGDIEDLPLIVLYV